MEKTIVDKREDEQAPGSNKTWRKIIPSNVNEKDLPVAREKFSMNVYDYSLFIYGGLGRDGVVLDDFYQFEIATRQWKRLKYKNGPGARHSHATAVHRHYLILQGGKDSEDNIMEDLWLFNFTTNTWHFIQNCNLPRYGHALHIIPNCNTLRLIGDDVVYDCYLGDDSLKFQLRYDPGLELQGYFGAVTNDQCTLIYGGCHYLSVFTTKYLFNRGDMDTVISVMRVNGVTVEYINGCYIMIGGVQEDNTPAKTRFYYREWDEFTPLNETELGDLPNLSYHRSTSATGLINHVTGGVKSDGELSNELYQYSEDQSLATVQLPDEIFVHEICKHLPVYSKLKIARASKHYCEFIYNLFKEEIMLAKIPLFLTEYIYKRAPVNIKLLTLRPSVFSIAGSILAGEEVADEIDPTIESWTGAVETCFGLVNVTAQVYTTMGAALVLCDVSDPKELLGLSALLHGNSLQHVAIVAYQTGDERLIKTAQLEELVAGYQTRAVIEVSSLAGGIKPGCKLLAEEILRRLADSEMNKTNVFSQTDTAKKGKKDKCTIM